jgi:Zn-dependent protease with chaperone function
MSWKSCYAGGVANPSRNEPLTYCALLYTMKDLLFVVALSLLAFGLINLLLSFAVALALLMRWLRFDCLPRARARRFLLVRAFPGAASLLFVGGFFIPVLCRSEPGNSEEQLSVAMCLLATIGIKVLADAVMRGIRSVRETDRLSNSWACVARPIELRKFPVPAFAIEVAFPVVAIVGLFHQRLYVARNVLASCSAEEFEAILLHERAHIRHGDNLLRLLLRLFPDLLAWTRMARSLERGWVRATEEAADDEAVAAGKGFDLASALCKVSRLAADRSPVAVVGIHGDGDIAHRLERLLRPKRCARLPSRGRFDWLSFVILLAAPLIAATIELPRLHAVIEASVRLLN